MYIKYSKLRPKTQTYIKNNDLRPQKQHRVVRSVRESTTEKDNNWGPLRWRLILNTRWFPKAKSLAVIQ